MEPITLCGAVIVFFGLWEEYGPGFMAIVRWISKRRIFAELITPSAPQRPAYVRRMPICLAKTSHY